MRRRDVPLTAERLRELVSYDPDTGEFERLVKLSNRTRIGKAARHADRHGHYRISVDGREYAAHRLAWLYMTGNWPQYEIDHINGDRANNSFSNLRDVPHRINMQNQRRAQSGNVTGYLGVSFRGGRYEAKIQATDGSRNIHLGRFDDPEVAHEAYLASKRRLHPGNTL